MFCGTGSPIVSGASFDALGKSKSFTFSLMMKRRSYVRLIVPRLDGDVQDAGGIRGIIPGKAAVY
jgi:hypothetical protein